MNTESSGGIVVIAVAVGIRVFFPEAFGGHWRYFYRLVALPVACRSVQDKACVTDNCDHSP